MMANPLIEIRLTSPMIPEKLKASDLADILKSFEMMLI